MATVISTESKSTESKPRRRRKRGSDRWVSELKGIVALLAAGFGLVALATFDPTLTPAEERIRSTLSSTAFSSKSFTES